LTDDPAVFYFAGIDSGYSVDNLHPAQPISFTAISAPNGVALRWGKNLELDLFGYRLYRGESLDFEPSPENLIAAQPDTNFVDLKGDLSSYYKLGAVDVHGNEGPFAVILPTLPGSAPNSRLTPSLRGAIPNPSTDGVLRLSFTLVSSEPATLEILDLAGRRLVRRNVSGLGPGTHELEVGKAVPLAEGVYVIRLTQRGRSVLTKASVLR
jgi:hypothetical protein